MRIKVQVESFAPANFEISNTEAKRLSVNSIGRVINTAIDICEKSKHQDAQVVLEDLTELKWLMVMLWVSAQSAVFAQQRNDIGE